MAYENAIAFDDSNILAKNNYAYFLSIDGGDLVKARELSAQTITWENADNATNLDTYAWILHLSGRKSGGGEVSEDGGGGNGKAGI